MNIKTVFWEFINKVVSHDNFRKLHHKNFPVITSPSLRHELLKHTKANISSEYPELTGLTSQSTQHPVFITARFRSGSTLIWNLFRQIEQFHCYYEPLNERKWFDKSNREDHTDETHIGVHDYWSEYNHIKNVDHLFCRNWTYRNLLMDQTSHDENMYAYIYELIRQSPRRPVLQFNRTDFRLPWLKSRFPNATLLHIYRNPRDLWISVIRNSAPIPLTISNHNYTNYNIFYTMEWAQDLSTAFPFLSPSMGKHPYYYHYLIWRLSYIYGKTYSDYSFSYEKLVTDTCDTLHTILDKLEAPVSKPDLAPLKSLVRPLAQKKWEKYADNDWYLNIEQECEHVINAFFLQTS